jgi:hypothetical protein
MFCRLLVLTLAVVTSEAALADVLIPKKPSLAERMANNPNAIEQVDNWCEGRAAGASCSIPGNPFEGGGQGTCVRQANQRNNTIDLRCILSVATTIDRRFPDGPYQAEIELCAPHSSTHRLETLRRTGWLCEPPPAVADRFCAGLASGADCRAEIMVGDRPQEFIGVCQPATQEIRQNYRATRPVLQCNPAHPAPKTTLKELVPWFRR